MGSTSCSKRSRVDLPSFLFLLLRHRRVQLIRSLLPYPALETSRASECVLMGLEHSRSPRMKKKNKLERNRELEYFQQTELLINTCSGPIKNELLINTCSGPIKNELPINTCSGPIKNELPRNTCSGPIKNGLYWLLAVSCRVLEDSVDGCLFVCLLLLCFLGLLAACPQSYAE